MGRKKKVKPESKITTKVLDKPIPKPIVYQCGANGEIHEATFDDAVCMTPKALAIPVTKHEKSYKYVPELDDKILDPIPPPQMMDPIPPPIVQTIQIAQQLPPKPPLPPRKFTFRKWSDLHNISPHSSFHIIGAGPSARDFIPQLAQRQNVISVNGVPSLTPTQYWYCCDHKDYFYEIASNRGMTRIVSESWEKHPFELDDEVFLAKSFPSGFISDPEKGGLFHGNSSVLGACDLARLMGAVSIVLWGVDYNDNAHSYDESLPSAQKTDDWDMERIYRQFDQLKLSFKHFNVNIFNASPASALPQFEKVDPHSALRY